MIPSDNANRKYDEEEEEYYTDHPKVKATGEAEVASKKKTTVTVYKPIVYQMLYS